MAIYGYRLLIVQNYKKPRLLTRALNLSHVPKWFTVCFMLYNAITKIMSINSSLYKGVYVA